MKQTTFIEAKRLQEQIDYLESQCQAIRKAQDVLLDSKKQPDDIFRFFTELMKCEYGANALTRIVDGIVIELNKSIQEKREEFEAL